MQLFTFFMVIASLSFADGQSTPTSQGAKKNRKPSQVDAVDENDINSVELVPKDDSINSQGNYNDDMSGRQKYSDDPPPVQKQKPGTVSSEFTVVTTKINQGPIVNHGVHLMNPPHKATFTPGYIKFEWKLADNLDPKKLVTKKIVKVAKKTKKVKKPEKPHYEFQIESLDGKVKIVRKTKYEERSMSLRPGKYKWRVVATKPKADSRWRLFQIIDLKSHNVTDLYQGHTPPHAMNTREVADKYFRKPASDAGLPDEPAQLMDQYMDMTDVKADDYDDDTKKEDLTKADPK